MSTQETQGLEATDSQTEREDIRSFLRVSAAYLFSCAYRDILRAAYARHATEDPIQEHELWSRREQMETRPRTVTGL